MINVLIVEDDPMVAEFNKRYLSQLEGFKLKAIARSFDEAVQTLQEKKVDLILLDIFMPGMTGLDLLSQIRKTDKEVDVIIVSAACDMQTIKKALQYGAVDYLIKPFEFERFKSALSSYRDNQRMIRHKDALSQEELDEFLLNKEHASMLSQLPKGLDKNTLSKVWTNIKETNESLFSTEEIAKQVGISRVSMRKYVEFLNGIGVLNKEIIYGSVGRPIYKYKCTDKSDTSIGQYL